MKQAQTTLEYVYLVGIVALAIIATLVYINRGFQGNLRTQADQLGEQYSPKNMQTNITEKTTVVYEDEVTGKDSNSKTTTTTTKTGSEKINRLGQESY